MKSFTDLKQSEVLEKILRLESADMHYNNASIKGINYVDEYKAELMDYNTAQKVLSKYLVNPMFRIIPCWSLAALLNELGKIKEYWFHHLIFDPTLNKYSVEVEADSWRYEGDLYDNAIDAVYETILKLHEQKSK